MNRMTPLAEWTEAERIRDLPEVDGALRNFLEDAPGDNATCIVRAVMRAVARGVAIPPAPGSEPFERWRKELRACLVQLLYVAHESKSPAECNAHPLYSSVMMLVDGGPSLASLGVLGTFNDEEKPE